MIASYFLGNPADITMAKPPLHTSPFWAAHVHADRRPFLLARGRIVAALREWFAANDFLEVETGALQVSPGNETHLHAFATTLAAPDGTASPLYLRTSPEFACKKLLAAGEQRIVEFAKVFRNRERGALHAPEFTMLEWYRVGVPYEALMGDCMAILVGAARATGASHFNFRGNTADAFADPERLTIAEAFARHAGIDVLATIGEGGPDRARLADAAVSAGIRIADNDTWGDIFSRVLVERIEPNSASDGQLFWTAIRRRKRRWRGPAGRSPARRPVRALCLRRGDRQRVRRTHRRW